MLVLDLAMQHFSIISLLYLATLLAGYCLNYLHDKLIKVSVCFYLLKFTLVQINN